MLRFHERVRINAGAVLVDGFFRGISAAGRLHPMARPARHDVEVLRDIAYLDDGRPEHRLDVYRPTKRSGPYPVVLYIHGGGFRMLSKDTHWLMGLAFSRMGYLVFNISYRLGPQNPFPAAIEDVCSAYGWLARHAEAYGGDLSRLTVAGESAGANLVAALVVATSYRRPEPYARAAFETGLVPHVAIPACGILQVSDAARFGRRKRLPSYLKDRLQEVEHAYLGAAKEPQPGGGGFDMANPLLVLERKEKPDRPLPAFFVPVGTSDPLLDDTRRLKQALDQLGVPCEARYYDKEPHAFHALVFREKARQCWQHTYDFLDRHLPIVAPVSTAER